MIRMLFVFLMLCICTNAALADYGYLVGPSIESSAYSGWTNDAVPIAYVASGDGCANNTNTTNPLELCATPHIIGQAACTDQTWSEHDMNISTASDGRYCWCRRTHVRVDGQIMSDVGPWYMSGIRVSIDNCKTDCPRSCANMFSFCNPVGAVVYLPRY